MNKETVSSSSILSSRSLSLSLSHSLFLSLSITPLAGSVLQLGELRGLFAVRDEYGDSLCSPDTLSLLGLLLVDLEHFTKHLANTEE
jgi:hypothetical protein